MPSQELVKVLHRLQKLTANKERNVCISYDISKDQYNVSEFLSDQLEPPQGDSRLQINKTIYITIGNLGMQDDKNRIRWPSLRFPLYRRIINYGVSMFCSLLPASTFKNFLYRSIGYKIGRNVEIAQTVILDPFCPGLVEIQDGTMIGSFSKIFTHAYKGRGEVMIGKVTIGKNCRILANSLMGPIDIDDDVIIMVNTVLTPYFRRIKQGQVVGHVRPIVKDLGILSQ